MVFEVLNRLIGGCLVDYAFGQNLLRLSVETPLARLFLPHQSIIQVVLENCRDIYYLSYTEVQEHRAVQEDLSTIFHQDLRLQGVQERAPDQFLLYCNACTATLAAGELHFEANGCQLYDQEFGRITYGQFIKTVDKPIQSLPPGQLY